MVANGDFSRDLPQEVVSRRTFTLSTQTTHKRRILPALIAEQHGKQCLGPIELHPHIMRLEPLSRAAACIFAM